jgi:hypothetical protein
MKKIILFSLLISTSVILKSQTTYEYVYDNAGNRVLRHIIVIPPAKSMQANKDSAALQENVALGEMQINVMPNPTVGRLQINITNLPENAEGGIIVWDLQSKELLRQEGIYANNPIDLSKQPKGIYLMQIRVGNKKSEWKVVKE